ncbi:MAG: hypothetical protein ACJASV_000269 [Pseudorhodobacter sp.]|jgi:hypothetical protein
MGGLRLTQFRANLIWFQAVYLKLGCGVFKQISGVM